MKKSLMLGLFGLAIGLNSSFGQGHVFLDNRESGTLITYGDNVYANGANGTDGTIGAGLDSNWTVGFYYALGVVAADPFPSNGPVSSQSSLATGPGSTAVFDWGAGPGVFFPTQAFNTGYPYSSTITFELVAYPTSAGSYSDDYAQPQGHSAAFTVTLPSDPLELYPYLGDYFTSFAVTTRAREPSTLALAGLGGASLLVALRRKVA